jgi:hypothetical protein
MNSYFIQAPPPDIRNHKSYFVVFVWKEIEEEADYFLRKFKLGCPKYKFFQEGSMNQILLERWDIYTRRNHQD